MSGFVMVAFVVSILGVSWSCDRILLLKLTFYMSKLMFIYVYMIWKHANIKVKSFVYIFCVFIAFVT